MGNSRWKRKGLELASEPVPSTVVTDSHEISNTIGATTIEEKLDRIASAAAELDTSPPALYELMESLASHE
jgi:hypothetical protein